MLKENGRLTPAENEELANDATVGKLFVCTNCKSKRMITNVQFGETPRCSECGGIMIEDI
jgi:hypothetical protein